MKNKLFAFIAICLVVCLVPSVCMLFIPTTQTTENKPMAEPPRIITEDNKLNKTFLQDCGEYYADHVALRNQMIFADAKIQTELFSESNVSGVVYGKNGWLYYSSTLDDYLGRNLMSDRDLYNLSHNISIVQDYLEQMDIKFVMVIPPNKNTLYGENMPYFCRKADVREHNAIRLEAFLKEQGVNYISLFDLFKKQDEVLYMKGDSHWNIKGANLVYETILDYFDKEHTAYPDSSAVVEKETKGDLNKMLYSFYGEPEKNYNYNLPVDYKITNGAKGVEDGWIVTENENCKGKLLMFRDSFADTLIPFISNQFETAYYSKGIPCALERYIEADKPDYVIIEKVERNISDYLSNPPIITSPTTDLPSDITIAEAAYGITVEPCMYDANYYTLSGALDAERINEDSEVVVCVDGVNYRAYHTDENRFMIYIKKSRHQNAIDLQVYSVTDNNALMALTTSVELPQ